ncbi:MAG: hypothetical protein R3C68_05565 [Myxococcota bacterium]
MPQLEHTVSTLLSKSHRLAKTLVFRDGEDLLGHLSALRTYERTWMCHHLGAVRPKVGRFPIVQVVHLALSEYLEQFPDMQWVRVYFRPNNPWANRVFGGFARQFKQLPVSGLRVVNYVFASTQPTLSMPAHTDIHAATPDELEYIEEYFVASGRSLALQSDDYTRSGLLLQNLSQEYAEIGLERRREVYVATHQGRIEAFALLEVSSVGLNFSELTNTFTVHRTGQHVDAIKGLILFAKKRYGELGRPLAIALCDDSELDFFVDAGFVKTKSYACWTWHRSLYPAFGEHVIRMTEGRR